LRALERFPRRDRLALLLARIIERAVDDLALLALGVHLIEVVCCYIKTV